MLLAAHIPVTGEAFGYRGNGLRGWKQNASGARTYYLYDGSTPVCELDGSGSVTAQNMFGAWGLVSRSTPARAPPSTPSTSAATSPSARTAVGP